MAVLTSYTWPGNIRELINVVRRMLAQSKRKTLSLDDVPGEILEQASGHSEQGRKGGFLGEKARVMEQFEFDYMVQVLKTCNGDVSAVARMADISRQSVYRMLTRLKLDPDDYRTD